MLKKINLPLVVLILTILLGCKFNHKKNEIKKKGFLLYKTSSCYFIPVNNLDQAECGEKFNSKYFKKAVQFDRSALPNLSYIFQSFDSLKIDGPLKNKLGNYIYITPINMEFSLSDEFFELYTSRNLDTSWNFKFSEKAGGKEIRFIYNVFPIKITKATPIFCLNKKESDIKECECRKRENDTNDYLFKICKYLKKEDKYSIVPCKYEIKNIVEDSLGDQKVIRVDLSCCYLGDKAYFDPDNNELIKVSFGAK